MGHELRVRLRVPSNIAREYTLVCEPAERGSFVQPISLEGTGTMLDLPSTEEILDMFVGVGSALSRSDWNALRSIVPDSHVRQRVVDEYVGLLPDPESGYGLELRHKNRAPASFNSRQVLLVREFNRRAREPATASAPANVIGELVKIDFGGRKITIRHYPTDRMLDCEYVDDFEEMLVANRRGLIQVSGLVELDSQDRPVRVTDVFDIQELDLSPIVIESIDGAVRKLRFRDGPRTFVPFLDEEGQLLVVEDDELDLHVYSNSRTGLLTELYEHIEFLWLEYAESTEQMTSGAAQLAARLRTILEVVADA